MKELKTGIIYTKDLAEWFGIKTNSFNAAKKEKLEELKEFADYQIISTKRIRITKVKEPVYIKQQSKAYQMIKNKINECWNKDGLDSCKRVGLQIQQELNKELALSPTTVYNYTRKGRNELYGRPFENRGEIGYCVYLWCKKTGSGVSTTYTRLTLEEEKIKEELLKKYFGNTTEKALIVQDMIDKEEIKKEDAWETYQNLTNLTKTNFKEFLDELEDKLQCHIVRGTDITRDVISLGKSAF